MSGKIKTDFVETFTWLLQSQNVYRQEEVTVIHHQHFRGAAHDYYGGPSYDVAWVACEESHMMFLSQFQQNWNVPKRMLLMLSPPTSTTLFILIHKLERWDQPT
jgi:hypothetical protein